MVSVWGHFSVGCVYTDQRCPHTLISPTTYFVNRPARHLPTSTFCGKSLRDILVRSTENSFTEQPGSRTCERCRCHTCEFINPLSEIRSPKSNFTIRDDFIGMSENLVYCISCRRCSHIYISETGRNLRNRFGEHLWSRCDNNSGFSVAQHFNSSGHSIIDVQVLGRRFCRGTNILRKTMEIKLIFQLGTVQPDGLNINFKYV